MPPSAGAEADVRVSGIQPQGYGVAYKAHPKHMYQQIAQPFAGFWRVDGVGYLLAGDVPFKRCLVAMQRASWKEGDMEGGNGLAISSSLSRFHDYIKRHSNVGQAWLL